jgi:hypothetical protein
MGVFTGLFVNTVRSTDKGSDYYGACEVCGKHMSEASVFTRFGVYLHSEGFSYLGAPTPGIYAHASCRPCGWSNVVNKDALPRRGRLTEYILTNGIAHTPTVR